MKWRVMIALFLMVAILTLSVQRSAFAGAPKGSPTGQPVHRVPNCPTAKGAVEQRPNCIPPAPCSTTGCYGIDPYASGCGTVETYNHISYVSTPFGTGLYGNVWVTYGYLTNYYSPWCIANWTIVSLTTTGYNQSVSIQDLQITTTDAKEHNEKMCYPNGCGGTYPGPAWPTWTNMVDGTNITYASTYADGGINGISLDPWPAHANQ